MLPASSKASCENRMNCTNKKERKKKRKKEKYHITIQITTSSVSEKYPQWTIKKYGARELLQTWLSLIYTAQTVKIFLTFFIRLRHMGQVPASSAILHGESTN